MHFCTLAQLVNMPQNGDKLTPLGFTQSSSENPVHHAAILEAIPITVIYVFPKMWTRLPGGFIIMGEI